MKKLLTIITALCIMGTNVSAMDNKAAKEAFDKSWNETPANPKYAARWFPGITYAMSDTKEFINNCAEYGKCLEKASSTAERSACYSTAAIYFAGFAKASNKNPKEIEEGRNETFKMLHDMEEDLDQ